MKGKTADMDKEKNTVGKSKARKIIFGAVIAAPIVYVLAIFIIVYFSHYTRYYIFTEKRTAQMEYSFGINVTDDFKLKKYEREVKDHLDLSVCTLWADNIDDYHDFMDKNIDGDIVIMEDNGVRYDFENDSQEQCVMNGYDAYYKYSGNSEFNKYVEVYFYRSGDGKYSAEFSYQV